MRERCGEKRRKKGSSLSLSLSLSLSETSPAFSFVLFPPPKRFAPEQMSFARPTFTPPERIRLSRGQRLPCSKSPCQVSFFSSRRFFSIFSLAQLPSLLLSLSSFFFSVALTLSLSLRSALPRTQAEGLDRERARALLGSGARSNRGFVDGLRGAGPASPSSHGAVGVEKQKRRLFPLLQQPRSREWPHSPARPSPARGSIARLDVEVRCLDRSLGPLRRLDWRARSWRSTGGGRRMNKVVVVVVVVVLRALKQFFFGLGSLFDTSSPPLTAPDGPITARGRSRWFARRGCLHQRARENEDGPPIPLANLFILSSFFSIDSVPRKKPSSSTSTAKSESSRDISPRPPHSLISSSSLFSSLFTPTPQQTAALRGPSPPRPLCPLARPRPRPTPGAPAAPSRPPRPRRGRREEGVVLPLLLRRRRRSAAAPLLLLLLLPLLLLLLPPPPRGRGEARAAKLLPPLLLLLLPPAARRGSASALRAAAAAGAPPATAKAALPAAGGAFFFLFFFFFFFFSTETEGEKEKEKFTHACNSPGSHLNSKQARHLDRRRRDEALGARRARRPGAPRPVPLALRAPHSVQQRLVAAPEALRAAGRRGRGREEREGAREGRRGEDLDAAAAGEAGRCCCRCCCGDGGRRRRRGWARRRAVVEKEPKGEHQGCLL